MERFAKRLPWLLLLASASLFFCPLTARVLWDSDEGRYAEIAREMLELKDWITPHLNYVVYFEKPPLMYWLTAISMSVFGVNEFAARFWCAIFGVLTVGVVYLLGKHWKSERCGLLAGGILATSLLFFALTQFLVLDMALTFWMTLLLYAMSRLIQEWAPAALRRFAVLGAIAAAGGILTKGPVAIVLPVAVLVMTVYYSGLWKQIRRTPWKEALGLCLLLTAPWFVAVSLKHPYFVSFFFIHEHLTRYLTTIHHRAQPIYFFIPVLLGGFLPWSVFLPSVTRYWLGRRGAALQRDPVGALLVIWTIFIVLFFSLSQSKLVAYVLPVFPAMALLVAGHFEESMDEETLPRWMTGGLITLIGLFIAGLILLKCPLPIQALQEPPANGLLAQSGWTALILGFGVFIFVGVWGMRRTMPCFGGILLMHVLLWTSLASLAGVMDPYCSSRAIAEWLRLNARPDQQIVAFGESYEDHLQTLGFYTRRRIAIYGEAGEMSLGAAHDPEAAQWFVPTPEAEAAVVRVPSGTWVVTEEGHWSHLQALGLASGFRALQHTGRLWLLQKI